MVWVCALNRPRKSRPTSSTLMSRASFCRRAIWMRCVIALNRPMVLTLVSTARMPVSVCQRVELASRA